MPDYERRHPMKKLLKNKKVWVAIAVAIIAIGYWWYTGQPAPIEAK